MREIKFRAWDKNNCRMVEVSSLSLVDGVITFKRQLTQDFNILIDGCYVELMQYTGLKDKNGKEIYEGDIVSQFRQDIHKNKMENRYPVCFGLYDNNEGYQDWVGGNGWYLGQELFFRSGKREAGGWESKYKNLLDADNLEVIGNIYENPELIQEVKEVM